MRNPAFALPLLFYFTEAVQWYTCIYCQLVLLDLPVPGAEGRARAALSKLLASRARLGVRFRGDANIKKLPICLPPRVPSRHLDRDPAATSSALDFPPRAVTCSRQHRVTIGGAVRTL